MSRVVLLDAGPLGMVANPTPSGVTTRQCQAWADALQSKGVTIRVPGIADYEVRRELHHAAGRGVVGAAASILHLDEVVARLGPDPITPEILIKAAELWGRARAQGTPTAPDLALDGDMILCAHAIMLAQCGNDVEIATTNVGHLSLFANARDWTLIIA